MTNTAPDMEFNLIVVRVSAKAILFTSKKDPLDKFWLPKSQITLVKRDRPIEFVGEGEEVLVQLPRWLAEAKEILA